MTRSLPVYLSIAALALVSISIAGLIGCDNKRFAPPEKEPRAARSARARQVQRPVQPQKQRPHGTITQTGIRQESPPGAARKPDHTAGTLYFEDDFERERIGENYKTGERYTMNGRLMPEGEWEIKDGALFSPQAYNHDLWLTQPLPRNARVELDMRSDSPTVDMKFIMYGSGEKHYTGYSLIMGGWNNRISIIARGHEHGKDRLERVRVPWEPNRKWQSGKTYHLTAIRKGDVLEWYVDDKLFLVYDDPQPLWGGENNKLGFANWKNPVTYDNLKIYDLGP